MVSSTASHRPAPSGSKGQKERSAIPVSTEAPVGTSRAPRTPPSPLSKFATSSPLSGALLFDPQPSDKLPALPPNLTEVPDTVLMEAMREQIEWQNFLGTKLA